MSDKIDYLNAPFDLNRDGKLDFAEQFLQYKVILDIISDNNSSHNRGNYDSGYGAGGPLIFDDDEVDEEEDEDDEDEEQSLEDILEENGLDVIDLEFMDEDERRETIEDAGLDPDDFDELF